MVLFSDFKKELKKRDIKGKEYNYIEYDNTKGKKYRTDFYCKFKVTDDFKESISKLGGVSRRILTEPIEELGTYYISIMVVMIGRAELMGVVSHMDKEGNILDIKYVPEDSFIFYITDFVEDRKGLLVDYEEGTTLNYLEDSRYSEVMSHYYNPLTENDSGVLHKGKTVEYNKTYKIRNIEKIEDDRLIKSLNKILSFHNIKEIDVVMNNMTLHFGDVAELKFVKEDGSYLTYFEKYYMENKKENQTMEEYETEEEIYWLHDCAVHINKEVDRDIMSGRVSKQTLSDRCYKQRKEYLEYNIWDNVGKDKEREYGESIGKGFLSLLASQSVKFEEQ